MSHKNNFRIFSKRFSLSGLFVVASLIFLLETSASSLPSVAQAQSNFTSVYLLNAYKGYVLAPSNQTPPVITQTATPATNQTAINQADLLKAYENYVSNNALEPQVLAVAKTTNPTSINETDLLSAYKNYISEPTTTSLSELTSAYKNYIKQNPTTPLSAPLLNQGGVGGGNSVKVTTKVTASPEYISYRRHKASPSSWKNSIARYTGCRSLSN